ncbi:MAG: hypothetical protein V4537_10440 [Pseudomonadota bacterium]
MNDQASENASARIERALARIEAAARRNARDHADLARRHATLRNEVGSALTALDSLIAGEGDD